ncbi:hypothetical protein ACLOJK_023201 [Asimina triloba]
MNGCERHTTRMGCQYRIDDPSDSSDKADDIGRGRVEVPYKAEAKMRRKTKATLERLAR